MRTTGATTNSIIINKERIKKNIQILKNFFPYKIISVLKSNAYGLGINNILPIVIGDIYKVAINNVEEFFEYRLYSYPINFIILFPELDEGLLGEAIKYPNLEINISSIEVLKILSYFKNSKIKVHLEVDTGMNRTGIRYDQKIEINGNLELVGIFTHLKNSNISDNIEQINRLFEFMEKSGIKLKGGDISIFSSAGLLNYRNIWEAADEKVKVILRDSNSARIGILQYGIVPHYDYLSFKKEMDIKTSIKFKVGFLGTKIVKNNETVGYTTLYSWKANKEMKLGLAYIGYSRIPFSKKIYFDVITNRRRFISESIGAMSMDIIAFDLNNLNEDEEIKELFLISENLDLEYQAFSNNIPVYNFLTATSGIKKYIE